MIKRLFLLVAASITLGVLVFFWWVGRTERLRAIEVVRGSGTFPETVAGLPIFKNGGEVVVQASHDACQKNPVSYCFDIQDRRYFHPDRTGRWAFSVRTARLVSGDISEAKADIISHMTPLRLDGSTVYFSPNSVIWFTDTGDTDMVTVVLMPLTGRNGTVGFGDVTLADVRSNSEFISTFLASFPPVDTE